MVELAEYVRDTGLYTEQVQDFTPTPMSISTAIYHTGLDPFTLEEVYVPKGREKRIQRALIHYRDPENYGLVREGLRAAGRGSRREHMEMPDPGTRGGPSRTGRKKGRRP